MGAHVARAAAVATLLVASVGVIAACGQAARSPADNAPTRAALPMWTALEAGSSWGMRSSTDGDTTHFHLRHLSRWGCWSGDLVDLETTKPSPADYWEPGQDVIGHQIELHDPDGSWRMVGTYTQSPNPSEVWTMQVHQYPGTPVPYVIVPGRQVNSDTRTEYYLLFDKKIVSACMHEGPQDAPAWGQHVYWRSEFTFSDGVLHAHYEENHECGIQACQIEDWTFAPIAVGMTQIAVLRGGGKPFKLVLRRG